MKFHCFSLENLVLVVTIAPRRLKNTKKEGFYHQKESYIKLISAVN